MVAFSRNDLLSVASTLFAHHGPAALEVAKRRALQADDPVAREAWRIVGEVIEQRAPGNDNGAAA